MKHVNKQKSGDSIVIIFIIKIKFTKLNLLSYIHNRKNLRKAASLTQ